MIFPAETLNRLRNLSGDDAINEAARLALEAAAQICENLHSPKGYHPELRRGSLNCAQAIRALAQTLKLIKGEKNAKLGN